MSTIPRQAFRAICEKDALSRLSSCTGMFHDAFAITKRHIGLSVGNTKTPDSTDVLIIGGGAMGSSTAFWLKERSKGKVNVTVIEKDANYAKCSTTLSVGGVRTQFSIDENIEMSLFGCHFIKNINKYLSVDINSIIDVSFKGYGYLFLASTKGADILKRNAALQCKLGAKNSLLNPNKLREIFPWLNTNGIDLGCYSLGSDGWFDPWSFLSAFKKKNQSLGTNYVNGQVIGFEYGNGGKTIEKAVVQLSDDKIAKIQFGTCVIAAGPQSGAVSRMAGIGSGQDLLSVALPIEPRKRYVYCFHCPEGPPHTTPLTIEPTGTYFRPEGTGGRYIAGRSPPEHEEPPNDSLEVDYEYFQEKVWPILSDRVPAFNKLKLTNAWAGFYEVNTLDHNGVVGPHPVFSNMFFASGFSGHGIQHSPAIGRAVSEYLLQGKYQTIDLSRFGYQRLCARQPLLEDNIV